ncbi:MAG TPA: DUF4139 domain-containing protein [Saprospiraceae bacterium]|nr:DUF4139 domain-containing protein [Saprospiraceae bacterium]
MKKHLVTLSLLGLAIGLSAQNLTVKHVTVFKNGKSLLYKSGKAPVQNGRYSMTELPEALFGTYWVESPGGELSSVFAAVDSVEAPDPTVKPADVLRKNVGKQVIIYVAGNGVSDMTVQGSIERIFKDENRMEYLVVKTKSDTWATVGIQNIRRFDFLEAPDFNLIAKKANKHLDLNFKTNKTEQEIGLSYLVNQLGWIPVYRLELTEKTKGHLALRAEIANDAEDLGDTELRLAVGIPNFAFANKKSMLVEFGPGAQVGYGDYDFNMNTNMSAMGSISNQLSSNDIVGMGNRFEPVRDEQTDGSQAEDFYFYTIKPGNFPKNSRLQFPIFETDVQPAHYYACELPGANTQQPFYYQERTPGGVEKKIPVSHFVEFKNTTANPWTTGVVNLLSQSSAGLQPLSQDILPYTAPGATCKVKIAETPEIRVTQGEGDVDRQENAKKFFSTTYDKVKIEAQVYAVNYKSEPVTLKIRRDIEGAPLTSEQKWTTKQEQATLRVNPCHLLEWVIELKPGEERKWTYSYEVYVNM